MSRSDSAALDAYCTTGPSPGDASPPTLHLLGAGRVGRSFLRLLEPGAAKVVAVTDSSGTLHDPFGLDVEDVYAWKSGGDPLAAHPGGTRGPAAGALERVGADVVVDATATDFRRASWDADLDRLVVRRGASLILAAKDAASRRADLWLDGASSGWVGINAALGGAGLALREELAALRAECVEVAVSGSASTTAILGVLERGGSLGEGVEEAGQRGFLEADPELDLRGWDAAVKLAVVARALWGVDVPPREIPVQDIRTVDAREVRAASRALRTTRLVGRARPDGSLAVSYEELPSTSPLAAPCDRAVYQYRRKDGSRRVHVGTGLGPVETARALLADLRASGVAAAPPAGAGRAELDPATGFVHLPADASLASGPELHPGHVAFESVGPPDAPTVVVLGGISAHRRVADGPGGRGWWRDQVGPGKAVDTGTYRVLSLDWVGGAGASSGPVSSRRWPAGAVVTTSDQARALEAVLDELGVERCHAIVGASYGGMVALRFAAERPHRVGRLCVLGAAHECHPMATAVRSIQRKIVRLGEETGRVEEGLALARSLGMTTYRSALEFAERFSVAPEDGDAVRFEVEGYLEARGRDFARGFHPEAYVCLSRSLDLHTVRPEEVEVPGTVVAFDTDTLVPPWTVRRLANGAGGGLRYREVSTPYGHDAFLKETAAVARILRDVLTRADEVGR